MRRCACCNHDPIPDEPVIRTTEASSSQVGSCSFCARHIVLDPVGVQAVGMKPHRVLVLTPELGPEVRICRPCALLLVPALRAFAR